VTEREGQLFSARVLARELALKFLYACDLGQESGPESFESFASAEDVGGLAREHARQLVGGVMREKPAIDAMIRTIARNWTLERMAAIDYELLFTPDISPALVIDSAIELSKRFSTENSGKFVNGILDRVKDEAARTKPAKEGG
jgi:N utilization substance protein B